MTLRDARKHLLPFFFFFITCAASILSECVVIPVGGHKSVCTIKRVADQKSSRGIVCNMNHYQEL